MNCEFSVSTGYKIFYTVVFLPLFGLGLLLLTLDNKGGFAMYIFPLLLMSGAISLIGTKLTIKVSIGFDHITQTSLFKTTSLQLKAITGYRITNKTLSIESVEAKITVRNYAEFNNYRDLLTWLNKKYKNIDAAEYAADMKNVLTDPTLGFTEQDREIAFKQAKYISIAYNVGGAILFITGFLLTESKTLVILQLIYPFLCIPVMLNSKGLTRFFFKKNSPYYSIFFGVYVVALVLLIKGFNTQYILLLNNFWVPFIITCVVFTSAIKFADRDKYQSPIKFSFAAILIIGGLYAAGSVSEVNCTFDNSAVKVYQAPVIGHSISHNKGINYHLVIGAWGPEKETNNITVSEKVFYHNTIGSKVNVDLKQGFLHIPWYTISQ